MEGSRATVQRKVFRTACVLSVVDWAAYFAFYVSLTLYLTRVAGLDDVEAGWVIAVFGALVCVVPPFAGAVTDRIGFRRALAGGYAVAAAGYGTLALAYEPPWTWVGLALVVLGGATSRSALVGTPAVTSDAVGRARAYSVLMQLVNVGCLVGKAVARPLRVGLGLPSLDAFAAVVALVGLAVTVAWFREPPRASRSLSLRGVLRSVARVGGDRSFLGLMFLVGTFWAVQLQLYATLPRYLVRVTGEASSPEWCANVNPIVVTLLIVPVTRASRGLSPVGAIGVALLLVAASSLVMGLGPAIASLSGPDLRLPGGLSIRAETTAMVGGAALSGVAECFLLPRWYEYVSGLAPPGRTALYVGWSSLNGLWANALGYGLSGYLVERWCPDPSGLAPAAAAAHAAFVAGRGPVPPEYARAHWVFLVYAGIGLVAALGLFLRARAGGTGPARPTAGAAGPRPS